MPDKLNELLKGFKDKSAAEAVAARIKASAAKTDRAITLMEVCGTHTMSIAKFGIRSLLPANVRLVSGPGCPVCVTPAGYLDAAFEFAAKPNAVIATFGDMMRVPGGETSLEREKAKGADARVVYSPLEALSIAQANPDKEVVFLAIGFETTIPAVAATLNIAKSQGIKNFSILCGHKIVPPALTALMSMPDLKIDGFLLPGHVSVILGSDVYREPLAARGVGGVVAGFEPLDILAAISALVEAAANGRFVVENSYSRAVRPQGNLAALALIERTFEPADSIWRGLGKIPLSGLALRNDYKEFDAALKFGLDADKPERPTACRCGSVLTGAITPDECPLFGKACNPSSPVGACMVSSEGTCAAYYKYG